MKLVILPLKGPGSQRRKVPGGPCSPDQALEVTLSGPKGTEKRTQKGLFSMNNINKPKFRESGGLLV